MTRIRQSLRVKRARSAVATMACAATVAACSSGARTPTSPTTLIGGHSVFVIVVPTCSDRGSCASAAVVGGREYVVTGIIKPRLATVGQRYAIGTTAVPYDVARTVPGEDPSIILSLHDRATGQWLVGVHPDDRKATAAQCRVVQVPSLYAGCTP
jgi:hypothetical protein